MPQLNRAHSNRDSSLRSSFSLCVVLSEALLPQIVAVVESTLDMVE